MFRDADKWIEAVELETMGLTSAQIYYHCNTKRDWTFTMKERATRNAPRKLILIASLPRALQTRIEKSRGQVRQMTQAPESAIGNRESAIVQALLRFPAEERDAWMHEVSRLTNIIQRYEAIFPKRLRDDDVAQATILRGNGRLPAPSRDAVGENLGQAGSSQDGSVRYIPSPAVIALSEEAACTDKTILAREPRRAGYPSQSTLDRWLAEYRERGGVCFLRTASKATREDDKRKAAMSPEAMQWVNYHWRQFRGPRHLYSAIQKKAKKEGWVIPSESWISKRWNDLPKIVLETHMNGAKSYTDKYAPYVPRTVADLDALQVLVGDHSQRDLFVLLRDGRTIARPWLTLWQCARTGLLWGRHLDTVPSAYTIGAAYANGVRAFGAQPLSRPDDGFFSYIYTDQGKDYKSRHLDGSIVVHKLAAKPDGGFELLRTEREVGLLAAAEVQKLEARGYNAREKMVERTHRDISDWEENTFEEWCGRDAKNKPDRWRELWSQHARFLKGKLDASPFIGFDEYLSALDGWIFGYNTREHTRTTLNNAQIVPLDEYRQLYTTRYEISEQALALLLMKVERRVILKNGVELFNFHYLHPEMAKWKGKEVEVRVSDDDYTRVWVILPDGKICEAEMLERSSIINLNKNTAKRVAEQTAIERKLRKDHSLLSFSMTRGLTTADRVAEQIAEEQPAETIEAVAEAVGGGQASVHRLTRMDGRKLRAVGTQHSVLTTDVIESDDSIFDIGDSNTSRVREFDYED
jgi:hypothetical protein